MKIAKVRKLITDQMDKDKSMSLSTFFDSNIANSDVVSVSDLKAMYHEEKKHLAIGYSEANNNFIERLFEIIGEEK